MRLSNRHERDFLWVTTSAARSDCNVFADTSNVFGNRHKAVTTKGTKVHEGKSCCELLSFTRARAPAPQIPTPHISCYMIAVGGAGSLGSPAAVSGNPIIKTARRNITIIPPK